MGLDPVPLLFCRSTPLIMLRCYTSLYKMATGDHVTATPFSVCAFAEVVHASSASCQFLLLQTWRLVVPVILRWLVGTLVKRVQQVKYRRMLFAYYMCLVGLGAVVLATVASVDEHRYSLSDVGGQFTRDH